MITQTDRPLDRPARGDERGFTMIEMAVVLLILSMVLAIIFSVLWQVQKEELRVTSRNSANGQASVMLLSLSRQVHAATTPVGMSPSATSPFLLATANELRFYSALGNANGPTLVDIFTAPACSGCSTNNLVENVFQPTIVAGVLGYPTYPGTPKRVLLGTGLVVPIPNPTTDCPSAPPYVLGIFQYFPLDSPTSTCLALDTLQSPPALTSTGSNQQFTHVENVTITITTLDALRPVKSPLSVLSLQVNLPNVDYTGT